MSNVKVEPPVPDVQGVKHEISLRIFSMLQKGRRYFGSAGASLTHHANNPDYDSEFKRKLTTLGLEGERNTSRKIQEWMKDKPNVVLVDSAHIRRLGKETIDPESGTVEGGDTDHVLIFGDHVVLIDSKRWQSKRSYSIGDKGNVMKSSGKGKQARSFAGGYVNAKAAKFLWKKYLFKNAKVHSIVCINAEKVYVQMNANWKKQSFRLLTIEKLFDHLEYIYEHADERDRTTINSTLISQIVVTCIKPFDAYTRVFDDSIKDFK